MRPSVGNIVPEEWKARYGKGICPVCTKPKPEWENKMRRIYCSEECSTKYNEHIFTWEQRREQIIKRDKYTCKNCGKGNLPWVEWEDRYYVWLNAKNAKGEYLGTEQWMYIRETNDHEPGKIKLEVDHIKAVVNGGEMWDEKNLQTLCHACHVWKTKNDLRTRSKIKKLGHDHSIIKLLDAFEIQKEEHT